ncbi:helix-turn-helix domain-containing protein [Kitasatospora indigofera]|uniref:helix-turn-helix domain-containing protein n=1 Tax=Kitasatospora indigofera TaxID=67307 RepID=UPI00167C80EA|nr:helix-turn-helix domain-containing protein [Kitasatospora indigofera]
MDRPGTGRTGERGAAGRRSQEAVPRHDLEVPSPHVLPFAIGTFDTIGPLSRAAFPHRHSFYEMVYVTGGRGAHVLDLAHWPLRPPHLCVITPGQVHHWDGAEELSGFVALFNEDFLDHPEDAAALRQLAGTPWLHLGAEAGGLAALFAELEREYRAALPGCAGVLRAYLHILVVRAARALTPEAPQPAGRAAELASRFTRLIATEGPVERQVSWYARELGVSASHLHSLVKEATGRTPGQLIRGRQALEAKRLLLNTGLTVRQIAGQAGFADPAYFCRFFRRETGVTPGEFRSAGAEKHHDPRIESIAGPPDRP